MIIDSLINIETYRSISPDIYLGLKFLADANDDITLGTHQVNERVKALVTEYETVECFERGYESHLNVIDIQYPVRGLERVKWSPIEEMEINIAYDKINDRTFYKTPSHQGTHIDIGNGVFAIMFPQDGHSPQHFVEKPTMIKKITIKVSI